MSGTSLKKKLLALCVAVALIAPVFMGMKTSAALTGRLTDQTNNFVSGKEYVIATASSIKDDQNVTIQKCAVLGTPVIKKGGTEYDSLDYAPMPESSPTDEFLWKITDEGNGKYSLYSVSQKKYMNLTEGKIVLTEEKATVKMIISGAKVTFENDQKEYLRFTNVDDSRYQCNSLNAREFKLYSSVEIPKEYEETEEPLLSVACFSDMHH